MNKAMNFMSYEGSEAFRNKQKALFDQLSVAEKECNKDKMEVESVVESRRHGPSGLLPKNSYSRPEYDRNEHMRRFRGKESIFKRPDAPAPRSKYRIIPDYHRNPQKWTKYTLEDVSNEDMTERSNTSAAISFLRELEQRRHNESRCACKECTSNNKPSSSKESMESTSSKASSEIQFKKPQTEKTDNSPIVIETDDKPVFRGSKIILPEYVVGQKQKKIKKDKSIVKIDRSKQLKLDHLHELDEDED